MTYDVMAIQDNLRQLLSPRRFLHSLGVQYTSANLAMKYGYNIEKAEIAGLLHDCAKYMSAQEMLQECEEYRIQVTEVEKESSFLLHSKLGAFYAKKEYNIEDNEILDAIIFHTTGKPNMSLLGKIVYIADYIEPSRKDIENLEQLRKVAYEDLDKAMYLIAENILEYIEKNSNKVIDPLTQMTCDYYKELCKNLRD